MHQTDIHGNAGVGNAYADIYGTSHLHPVGVTMLVVFGLAMLVLPRRHAMVAFIAFLSFVACGQRLVIVSLDFTFIRLLVMFGWARLILRGESGGYRWSSLDVCVLALASSQLLTYSIVNGMSGFVYRLGTSFDSLGTYFMARILIKDLKDVRSFIYGLALISIPVACFFLVERSTQRNLFAVFGGIPEFTQIREGKLRCQGAYAHPILAGCFWAVIFPLFVSQALSKGLARMLAILGMGSTFVIIVSCASSTPITGLLGTMIGFAFIPFRRSLGMVRLAIVALLLALNMVMKGSVFNLIAKVSLVGGSTGWHRSQMLDSFIAHTSDWFLFGTNEIKHWGVFANDLCNHYVLVGTQGGAISLALFIWMLVIAFGNVGRAWRRVERSREDFLLTWAIGISMFVHTINFIGVAYFGQSDFLWYISLAMTCAVPSVRNPGRPLGATVASRADPRVNRASSVLPAGYR